MNAVGHLQILISYQIDFGERKRGHRTHFKFWVFCTLCFSRKQAEVRITRPGTFFLLCCTVHLVTRDTFNLKPTAIQRNSVSFHFSPLTTDENIIVLTLKFCRFFSVKLGIGLWSPRKLSLSRSTEATDFGRARSNVELRCDASGVYIFIVFAMRFLVKMTFAHITYARPDRPKRQWEKGVQNTIKINGNRHSFHFVIAAYNSICLAFNALTLCVYVLMKWANDGQKLRH